MKWLVLAAVLIIIFIIQRRIRTESAPIGPVAYWLQRPDMSFEEFYSQYYASSGLDRDFVRNALEMVAHATAVPATKLRPEDRIDDLKPGALHTALSLLQRIDSTGLLEKAGLPHPQNWQVETVDGVIKFLTPYYEHMKVRADLP